MSFVTYFGVFVRVRACGWPAWGVGEGLPAGRRKGVHVCLCLLLFFSLRVCVCVCACGLGGRQAGGLAGVRARACVRVCGVCVCVRGVAFVSWILRSTLFAWF